MRPVQLTSIKGISYWYDFENNTLLTENKTAEKNEGGYVIVPGIRGQRIAYLCGIAIDLAIWILFPTVSDAGMTAATFVSLALGFLLIVLIELYCRQGAIRSTSFMAVTDEKTRASICKYLQEYHGTTVFVSIFCLLLLAGGIIAPILRGPVSGNIALMCLGYFVLGAFSGICLMILKPITSYRVLKRIRN